VERKKLFLSEALLEALRAKLKGEVPVGCVVVKGDEIIARAHNLTESLKDPTAHAEILAIREATKKLGRKFLNDCELYVTLEPCVMCAYACVLARVGKLVFGAPDRKHGGVISVFNILDEPTLNHKVRWEYFPLEGAGRVLSEFFKGLRGNIK